MPFLKLEISKNIYDKDRAGTLLKDAAGEVQEAFNQHDIPVKSTVYICDFCLIGDGDEYQALASLSLKCFPGRSEEVRSALSKKLVKLLEDAFDGCGFSVNIAAYIIEIDRKTTAVRYIKNRTAEETGKYYQAGV